MPDKPQRVHSQCGERCVRRGLVEAPCAKQDVDQRGTEDPQRGGCRNAEDDEHSQRADGRRSELLDAAQGGVLGQGREHDGADGRAQDRLRHLRDDPGVVERGQAPGRECRCQGRVDDQDDLHGAEGQHARPHQPEHQPHAGNAKTEDRPVPETVVNQPRDLHEEVQDGADHHTVGQAPDAVAGASQMAPKRMPRL